MQGKSLDFANLYDVRAFRILVDDVKGCYAALGLVHNVWQPIPREFDDYIARPKPNGYQSLHTVVMDADGVAFEIQIRTQAMHQQAEYGLAAHWRYKEGAAPVPKNAGGTHSAAVAYERQIAWARQLISWKEDAWDQLKNHAIDDHIYVLTPLGKVIALEKGSSPIDFAYAVHTDLGHRCRGARVDGSMPVLPTAKRWRSSRSSMADHRAIGLARIGATCVPNVPVRVFALGLMRSTMRKQAQVALRNQVLRLKGLQRKVSLLLSLWQLYCTNVLALPSRPATC